MDGALVGRSSIILHPEKPIFVTVSRENILKAATLQARMPGVGSESQLDDAGAEQTPQSQEPFVQQPRSIGEVALRLSEPNKFSSYQLIWLGSANNQLCILERKTGQLHFVSVGSGPAAAHTAVGPDPATEADGTESSFWSPTSWLGGFFGAAAPQYEESDWHSATTAAPSLADADTADCTRHTMLAYSCSAIPSLQLLRMKFGSSTQMTGGQFQGAPPSASVHAVYDVKHDTCPWDALCILRVQEHGVEKSGLLYGLLGGAAPAPVLLGCLPFPALTVAAVQLTQACAVCIVQTGDAAGSTIGLTTPLKANGKLCLSWAEEGCLRGCSALLAVNLPGDETVLLAQFHNSNQVTCLKRAEGPRHGALQRMWEATLPGPAQRMQLGAPIAISSPLQAPKVPTMEAAVLQQAPNGHVPARARNPLQRRVLPAAAPGGAKGRRNRRNTPQHYQHVWIQCTDQVLWVDLSCGLWIRCPGFSAQQQVLALGHTHALVETFPLPGADMAANDSDDELLPELQVLPLPCPALVCRSGVACGGLASGGPPVETLSLGAPSPSCEVFLVPGGIVLMPPSALFADHSPVQPRVLQVPGHSLEQVGSLHSLQVSAGNCFQGGHDDGWRLLVLEGTTGSLVSAFQWGQAGCRHLVWQRILAAPGRALLQTRIVGDQEVHVLSKSSSEFGKYCAHVTVFRAILMFGQAGAASQGPPDTLPSGLELHTAETWEADLGSSDGAHLTQIAYAEQSPARLSLRAAVLTSRGNHHSLLRAQVDGLPSVCVACDKPVSPREYITGVITHQTAHGASSQSCIALRIARHSPVMLVQCSSAGGAVLCRLQSVRADDTTAATTSHNSHSEQRLAISVMQLTATGQREVLRQTLQHSQLPANGYLHSFSGEHKVFECCMSLSQGLQLNISHALLIALACVEDYRPCLPLAAAELAAEISLAVVPVVAQQLELALVHVYLLQAAFPGSVQCVVDCLSGLGLEEALATVIITARKGEVSELKQWNSVAGHPLLLWAASVQCLISGIGDVALHTERVKHKLHKQLREGEQEVPTAEQHTAAAAELQVSISSVAAHASLAAYAATQSLMLVQETYLMGVGSDADQLKLESLPWLQSPSSETSVIMDKAMELAQAMLEQLGGTSPEPEGGDPGAGGAFWVMQLVVACTTRTGVEVQRLLQLLEPVLPRSVRSAVIALTNLDDLPKATLLHLPTRVQRLLLFVVSLRGLQEQVRAFTARMLRSRDSVASAHQARS